MDYKVNAKNTKIIFSASTAIKVEPSRRKPSNRNVAIQALKSQETSPSACLTSTGSSALVSSETTQDDLTMWSLSTAAPFGLPSAAHSYSSSMGKL